jgi:hypothetical protein
MKILALITAWLAFAATAADMASQKWVEMKLAELRADIERDYTASGGVTQAWVEQTVSNAVANSSAELAATAENTYSNGVRTISVGSGKNRITMTVEDASVFALMATNATSAAAAQYGITNGFLFVWNGDGTYVGGNGEIVATTTNLCFQWQGNDSVRTNGMDVFTNWFGIVGAMIQPSVAVAATNGLVLARADLPIMRELRLIGSLLVGEAFAETTKVQTPLNWPDSWLPDGFDARFMVAKLESVDKKVPDAYVGYINGEKIGHDDLPDEWKKLYKDNEAFQLAFKAFEAASETAIALDFLAKQIERLKTESMEVTITDPETKTSVKTVPAPSASVTRNIYAPNIINRTSDVDGVSIMTNSSGRLALYDFPTAVADTGAIPFRWYNDRLPVLGWLSLKDLFDGSCITARTDATYHNLIDGGGVTLAGWDAPTSGSHDCGDNLADMLVGVGSASSHYVLTRYDDGHNGVLHYTEIGDLSASLGTAIKFIGTDGNSVVVGSGAETNDVLFASRSDSDVQVDVERHGNKGVKISIGVYYK